jgi:hypothetical protein
MRAEVARRIMKNPTHIHHVGPHRVELHEPDLCLVVWDGEVTAEHIREAYPLLDGLGGGTRPIFVLQDVSRTRNITAGARKLISAQRAAERFVAVISYGASFQIRVIVQMVERVERLFRPSLPQALFFATEAEARAFLDAEGPRLLAEYARSRGTRR